MLVRCLRRLKEDTRDLHVLAETHVRILDAEASLSDYRQYLQAMAGFHAPIEDVLSADPALAAAGFDAPARRKAFLAVQDLRAMGSMKPSPRCTRLPAAGSLARRIGIAYVIEGSTLGGRYILAKLPPALAGVPVQFLRGYGASTGSYWKEFTALAERLLVTSAAEDDAVAGARDTFERMIAWLAVHGRMRAAS